MGDINKEILALKRIKYNWHFSIKLSLKLKDSPDLKTRIKTDMWLREVQKEMNEKISFPKLKTLVIKKSIETTMLGHMTITLKEIEDCLVKK